MRLIVGTDLNGGSVSDDFENRADRITALVEKRAKEVADNAAFGGCMHDGGASSLREQIEFFNCGRRRVIPSGWAQYEKQIDPEYTEYLRLKQKFGDR